MTKAVSEPWMQLPADSQLICGRTDFGWVSPSYTGHNPACCTKQARWFKRETCFCGDCDMSMALCDEHFKECSK